MGFKETSPGRCEVRRRVEHTFESRPESVAAARALAAAVLNDFGIDDTGTGRAFLSDILLIVSELSTNAIQATAEDFRLTIAQGADGVNIAMEDRDPRPAQLTLTPPDRANGPGLALVAALSTSWGQDTRPANGKTVWARVARPPA